MSHVPQKPRRSRWRTALFTVHLWLGLASGILFSIVCASGFLIALHPVLEARFNREILVSQSQVTGWNRADETVRRGLGQLESPPRTLIIFAEAGRNWMLRGEKERLYLDPSTGQTVGELPVFWRSSYDTLVRLHRWLLLDSKMGRPITGAAALIYLCILSSGAALWLSKCYRNLGQSLFFRKRAGWKRQLHDAHLVLGAYAFLPLILMPATGLYWSYREPYKAAVYVVLEGSKPPAPAAKKKGPPRRQSELSYQAMLETVEQQLPYPGEIRLKFPDVGDKTVKVEKVRPAGLFRLPTADELTFELKTSQVVSRKPFAERSPAEKFTSQIYNIHTGAIWGDFSLALYLLATAIGCTLPITGTVMWWNRQRGLRKARAILAQRARHDCWE